MLKSISESLMISVALHALVVYSLVGGAPEETPAQLGKSDPIMISYVELPSESKEVPAKKVAVKQARNSAQVEIERAKRLKRIATYKKAPVKLAAPITSSPQSTVSKASVAAPAIASSAELLSDPKKGKIFSGYFGHIKEKIQKTLRKKHDLLNSAEGKVTVYFILNAEGGVEGVSVMDGQTQSSDAVKKLVTECVFESAPFGNFPKELSLNKNKIAFSLTIFFEDL